MLDSLVIPNNFLSGNVDVSSWMESKLVSGRTIEVPAGSTIRWANRVVKQNVSDVTIRGSGTFKAFGVVDRALLELTGGCRNWRFDAVRWDCNQAEQDDTYVPFLTYRNTPLVVTGAGNNGIFLRDCSVSDIYTDALVFYQGTGAVVIDGCTFSAAAHHKQQAGNFVTFVSMSGTAIEITNNRFICRRPTDPTYGMGGIILAGISGQRGKITNNVFEHVGRNNTTGHRTAVIDFYDSCSNWDVSENEILSNWIALRISQSQDIDFTSNLVRAYGSPYDGGILGIATGVAGSAKRSRLNRNKILYVGPRDYAASVAIQVSCSDNDKAVFDCEISDNIIENVRIATHVAGSVDGLTLDSNTSRGCVGGFVRADYAGASGLATNRKLNNVSLRRNKFLRGDTGQGCTMGISCALPNSYSGRQTPIGIEANRVECHDRATSLGVVTFGSDVVLRDNNVDSANIAYYVRGRPGNTILKSNNHATNSNTLETN